jgi:Ca-activated chloride channel homolog
LADISRWIVFTLIYSSNLFSTVPQVQLKVDVTLVLFDVVVRDAEGQIRAGLQAEDFVLRDNGSRQPLTHFSRDLVPLAVALVVDRSASVQDYLQSLRIAALSALGQLKPEDKVVLFSFGECPDRLSELTQDRARIAREIGRISGGGSTNIFGAIYSAARFLRESAPDFRKAIILVSDNYPNVFHIHEDDALREALGANTTLYSIQTPGSDGSAGIPRRPGQEGDPESVSRIVRRTGGKVLELRSLRQVSEALDTIVLELKTGYTLGFAPADLGAEGSYHEVSIVTQGNRCHDCIVQARSGYYVGVAKRSAPEIVPTSELYDCEESLAYSVVRNINARSADLREIPLKVSLSETTGSSGRQRKVIITIGGKKVVFNEANGRYTGRVLVAVFCRDAKGKNLFEDWKRLDMALREDTYQTARISGIPYSTTVPAIETGRDLQVVVYDLGSRRIGTRILRNR